jgi:hypothetical protein
VDDDCFIVVCVDALVFCAELDGLLIAFVVLVVFVVFVVLLAVFEDEDDAGAEVAM